MTVRGFCVSGKSVTANKHAVIVAIETRVYKVERRFQMDDMHSPAATVKTHQERGSHCWRSDACYDRALRQLRRSVQMLPARDGTSSDFRKSVLRACDEVMKLDVAELPGGMATHYLQLKHVVHRLNDASSPDDLATCAQWIVEMAETLERETRSVAIAVDTCR